MSFQLNESLNAIKGDVGLKAVLSRSMAISTQNFVKERDGKKDDGKQKLLKRLQQGIYTLETLLEEKPRGRSVQFQKSFNLAPFRNTNRGSLRKIERVLYVLRRSLSLMKENKYVSLRGLYYESELFRSQDISNRTVDLACAFVHIPRHKIRIMASQSGYVFGGSSQTRDSEGVYHGLYYRTKANPAWKLIKQPLQIKDELIFAIGFEFRSTRPIRSIVVVEKETIFRKLRTEFFCEKNSSIIITGEGQPSFAARACLFYLRRDIARTAGTFCICDYNPSGIYIMRTWMYSSPIHNELAKLEGYQLSCETLKFIGLQSCHIRENNIYSKNTIKRKFTGMDFSKIRTLKNLLEMEGKCGLMREMELMEQYGHSVELDQIKYIALSTLIQRAIFRRQYL